MKVSAIPAQITTIEDRIAGNLNLTQLLLLATPLFMTAIIFFLFPPIGRYNLYKLIIALILTLNLPVLAIRIKDKILLDLIKLRVTYELRPKKYVYRKVLLLSENSQSVPSKQTFKNANTAVARAVKPTSKARLDSQRLLADSRYNVVFQSKAGGLVVKVSL